jgi:hypothetical protein
MYVRVPIHDNNNKAPVDWPSVDVITDGDGLCKFLCWLNPLEGREEHDFRIDMELVRAKRIVMSRWEGRTREPPTGKIYGFAFEAAMACAALGCPSSGHHRTITYMHYHCMYCDLDMLTMVFCGRKQDMLDMRIMARFEVDMCSPS